MNDFTFALYILGRCILYPFELLRGVSGGGDGFDFFTVACGVAVVFVLGRVSVKYF